jgi:hypothetical protein
LLLIIGNKDEEGNSGTILSEIVYIYGQRASLGKLLYVLTPTIIPCFFSAKRVLPLRPNRGEQHLLRVRGGSISDDRTLYTGLKRDMNLWG